MQSFHKFKVILANESVQKRDHTYWSVYHNSKDPKSLEFNKTLETPRQISHCVTMVTTGIKNVCQNLTSFMHSRMSEAGEDRFLMCACLHYMAWSVCNISRHIYERKKKWKKGKKSITQKWSFSREFDCHTQLKINAIAI